jgi:hypothetical protein
MVILEMANEDFSNGRFTDELFPTWTVVPVKHNDERQVIIGYIDNTEHYAGSCQALAVEINFRSREVVLGFIDNSEKPVSEMTGEELVGGDAFLHLKYDEADWANFVRRVGTYNALKMKIIENAAWLRRRHLVRAETRSRELRGSRKARRKTRKARKARK